MDTHTSAGTQAPSGPVPTAVAGRPAADRDRRITGWRVPRSWPLLPVLVVQAVLSLRLVRADTAFQDEALYLWAGHLQWAHWLHGTVIPPFAYYFAGAPVIYPPLGALADSVGDLAGARMLSLVFIWEPPSWYGALPGGCSAGAAHFLLLLCSRCWDPLCSSVRWPPLPPRQCSWSRWPRGW